MLNIRQADMLFFIGNRLRTTLPRRRLNGQLASGRAGVLLGDIQRGLTRANRRQIRRGPGY
jgi:hypothetical protein